MSILRKILDELDESYIVENITKQHDEARIHYTLRSITVEDDIEFDNLIADYYNYHFTKCISNGGELPRAEASGRAKEIITRNYQRRKLDKLNAYSDGKTGSNGGMREILDIIMEALKEEAIEKHYRDVIDRYIAPSSWEEQVDIIKELFRKNPDSPHINKEQPERYARNYEDLIRGLVEVRRTQSTNFRRL